MQAQGKKVQNVLLTLIALILLTTAWLVKQILNGDGLGDIMRLGFFSYHVTAEYKKGAVYANSLVTADTNNDGKLEVIAKTKELSMIDRRGRLLTTCPTELGTSGNGNEQMIIDNIYADDHQEIITLGSVNDPPKQDGPYKLYIIGLDCQILNSFTTVDDQGETKGLYTMDIDGDGKKEIIAGISSIHGTTIAIVKNGQLETLPQTDDLRDISFLFRFLVEDLDGDGRVEFIAEGMNGVVVLDQRGQTIWKHTTEMEPKIKYLNEFAEVLPALSGQGKLLAVATRNDEDQPRTYIFDAKGTLITTLAVGGPIAWATNGQTGVFVAGEKLFDSQWSVVGMLPKSPAALFIVDLNGDGQDEIVSLSNTTEGLTDTPVILSIFDQHAKQLWSYRYPHWIDAVAFGDLNNNGRKEIVVSGHFDVPITIFSAD